MANRIEKVQDEKKADETIDVELVDVRAAVPDDGRASRAEARVPEGHAMISGRGRTAHVAQGSLSCTLHEITDDIGQARCACFVRDAESGRELLHSCDCQLPCTEQGCRQALESYRLIAPQVERAAQRKRGEGACTLQAMEGYTPRHEFARWRCSACGAVLFAPKRTLPPAFCAGCGRRVALIE